MQTMSSNIDFPHEVTEHFHIDKGVSDKSFGIIDLSNTLDFFIPGSLTWNPVYIKLYLLKSVV